MSKGCAVVTGASRGLGEGIALKLASEGYDIVINYVSNAEKAKAVAGLITDKYGMKAELVQGDVAEYEVCKKIIETAIEKFGKIDILVNNAGIAIEGSYEDVSIEQIDKMVQTNLMSVLYCCHLAVPHMTKAGKGCIVNMASNAGIMGVVNHVPYSTAKAGVLGITKALASEMGPYGVTVNAIAPGMIMTDMLSGIDQESVDALVQMTPLRKIGKVEDVAECVWYIVNAGFLTGQYISPNGGTTI